MQAIKNSYWFFLKCMWKNWALCFSLCIPILCGLFLDLSLPKLNDYLDIYFHTTGILLPFYPLFQLILFLLPALMIAFISITIVLEEIDNGITKYLCITPVGKKGYLLTRFYINATLIIPYTMAINRIFNIYPFTIFKTFILSFLFSLVGYLVALIITSLAQNKVEGMAFMKLVSMMFLIGLPIPFWLSSNMQYIFSFLPTFWIAKLAVSFNIQHFILSLICSLLWYNVFKRKFEYKKLL